MVTVFALLVVGGFAVYCLRPDERARVVRTILDALRRTWGAAQRHSRHHNEFDDALAARTRRPFLTVTLVGYFLAMFVLMVAGPGAVSEPGTLVRWGASVGPMTTNGQWWRLVTSTFVHAGLLQLLVNVAAFAQAALLIERMFGQVALAGVYLAAAAFSGAICLWADPLAITYGASGAIFGLYGLLVALVVRGMLQRSPGRVPLRVLRRLAPAAAVFVLYRMFEGGPQWSAGMAAFVVSFAMGLALTRDVEERKPAAPRVLGLATTPLAIAMMIVTPLSGMTDIRSEIASLVAVDTQTGVMYLHATEQFKRGALNADALAQLIDHAIIPKLEAGRARLNAVDGVARQQQPLVAAANEYVRLRCEGWALRATALHKANLRLLRDADQRERESMDALEALSRLTGS